MADELNLKAADAKRRFEIPVPIAALLAVPVIIVEQRSTSEAWLHAATIANWAIWGAFFLEYVTVLSLGQALVVHQVRMAGCVHRRGFISIASCSICRQPIAAPNPPTPGIPNPPSRTPRRRLVVAAANQFDGCLANAASAICSR